MTEMTDAEMTPGEIARSLARLEASMTGMRATFDTGLKGLADEVRARHHELANSVNVQLGPISEHRVRIDRLESDVTNMGVKVENVKTRNDAVSGASAALAVVGAWLVSWLRH